MKYIQTFERHFFKAGDYAKCIDPPITDSIIKNKIYIIIDVEDNKVKVESEGGYISDYFAYRFVKATPNDIEQYEIEQNLNN